MKRLLIPRKIKATNFINLTPSNQQRLTESGWQLLFYTCAWIFCYEIVSNVEWYNKTYLCWEPPFPNQDIGYKIFFQY